MFAKSRTAWVKGRMSTFEKNSMIMTSGRTGPSDLS